MRRSNRAWSVPAAVCAAFLLCTAAARGQTPSRFGMRPVADGLNEPRGVAIHPVTREIYVSELATGQILVFRNGSMVPALEPGWTVSEDLPRWAITPRVSEEAWMKAELQKPGPISISTSGVLVVAEQIPDGRILEFTPDEEGKYSVGKAVPVPWLDQEFQWNDVYVDQFDRLFITGADEVGSDFMKFGSALVRQPDGNWWVIDFGPFANFGTFALSARQDVMILGDRNKGTLSWWELERHIMLGGSPEATGRAELSSLAIYPDGAFVIAEQREAGKAVIKRTDPFTGQEVILADTFRSVGDIAMDREKDLYLVTDTAAGKLVECKPNPPLRFTEAAMKQIVRSVEGMTGLPSEAPAFLTSFFDRLQSATSEIVEDSTHAVSFNLSDIAGKMPIVAGRIRAAIEVEGAEEDPLEEIEFFLLFPSKVVMTESAVSPSMSFFSARRKSGKIEQTRPVFSSEVGVYRLSGTNFSRIASAPGGLHIPVVTCGLDSRDGGIYVNLSFLGAGVYGDYYLTLFQGPREQTAKLVVKSPETESGMITYEASFIDETTIEGMDGKITKEQLSNLLISGFGSSQAANRSVGWLRLGQFPASMTVGFGDKIDVPMTGAQSDLKEIVERRRLEMSLETAEEVDEFSPGEGAGPGNEPAPAGEAPPQEDEAPPPEEAPGEDGS